MIKDKTKKIFTLILALNIVVLSVFCFMLWKINSYKKDSESKVQKISLQVQKEESYLHVKKDFENYRDSIDRINGYIVGQDGIVNFIKDLESMTLRDGLKSDIKSVSFEPVVGINAKYFESIRIKADISGEWRNLDFFLRSLETYSLKLDIKSISFVKVSDTSASKKIPQWVGSFEFTLLKIKDK